MADYAAPGIPTNDLGMDYNPQYDQATVGLQHQMDAQYPYPPTRPAQFPVYVRYPGLGIYEQQYTNVGYHMLPVPNEIIVTGHYEAPEVPVSHLPYPGKIFDSTLAFKQQGDYVWTRLRAPGVNEGMP